MPPLFLDPAALSVFSRPQFEKTGIGMSTSGGGRGAHRMAQFVEGLADKGIDCKDLAVRIRTTENGRTFLSTGLSPIILTRQSQSGRR
jgi:hypothetical protein